MIDERFRDMAIGEVKPGLPLRDGNNVLANTGTFYCELGRNRA